jgi:hypothetical protein
VVYFENPVERLTSQSCAEPRGRTDFVLADNWFVCTRYGDPLRRR